MEEAAGSLTCLLEVSVVGLFSSFVVFPSLLEEGAAKPQGKSSVRQGLWESALSALRALGEGGGASRRERAAGSCPWKKCRWCL